MDLTFTGLRNTDWGSYFALGVEKNLLLAKKAPYHVPIGLTSIESQRKH